MQTHMYDAFSFFKITYYVHFEPIFAFHVPNKCTYKTYDIIATSLQHVLAILMPSAGSTYQA